jgi:hypothetical protein
MTLTYDQLKAERNKLRALMDNKYTNKHSVGYAMLRQQYDDICKQIKQLFSTNPK